MNSYHYICSVFRNVTIVSLTRPIAYCHAESSFQNLLLKNKILKNVGNPKLLTFTVINAGE